MAGSSTGQIIVKGANENNLKNVKKLYKFQKVIPKIDFLELISFISIK